MTGPEILIQLAAGLILPLCVILIECIFAMTIRYRVTVYHIAFSAFAPSAFAILCLLIPNLLVRYLLQGVLLVAILVLYISQFIYYRIFQTLFITQSLRGAGKAMQFIRVAITKIEENIGAFLLFLVPGVLYFAAGYSLIWLAGAARKIQAGMHGGFLLLFLVMLAAALLNEGEALSPRFLLKHAFVTEPSLKRFGLLMTMAIDVKVNVFGIVDETDPKVDLRKIRIVRAQERTMTGLYTEASDGARQTQAATPRESSAPQKPEPSAGETGDLLNQLDIRFPEGEDKSIQAMHSYFSKRTATARNSYTGFFRGKNLILITAESFSKYLIDPVLTPTLHRMATQGFQFNHFYTPLWGVSTSDGEFVATSGLIPKSGIWSYTKIAGNRMPFALGNQFRSAGYETRAYHNNTYTYYNRDRSYPTMGYTYKGLGSGLEVRATWPESDLEMVGLSAGDYVGKAPFHVYYLSVSGHMEYSFENNYIAGKNRTAVETLPYSESVKAYIACSIELEYALAELISRLKAEWELENTVIALSADHYPYGLSHTAYEELAGRTLDKTFEIYENAFLLWSASMQTPVVVDKTCSSLDILPTLSNLFGLSYDSRLLFGTDILSPSFPTVFFQDRSFINEKMRFDAAHQEITLLTEEEIEPQEIQAYLKDVADRFRYSAKVIETDYYRRLFSQGE